MRWPPRTTCCRRRAGRAPTSRKIVDEEMAPYRADHRQRVITSGPAVDAAAGHRAGRGAGAARARHQRRQVRRAVDRDRHAQRHLAGRSATRWSSTGRRPAARRRQSRPRRWASASPSCAPASRRSSAAASATTGGPRACAARSRIPAAQIAAPPPAAEAPAPAPGRQPTHGAASPACACWWSRTSSWSACWSRRSWASSAPPWPAPTAGWPTALAAAKAERFDGAILDLNLAGELADPLADFLLAHGVPFVFITGYQRDSIDRRYANVPRAAKADRRRQRSRACCSRCSAAQPCCAPPTAIDQCAVPDLPASSRIWRRMSRRSALNVRIGQHVDVARAAAGRRDCASGSARAARSSRRRCRRGGSPRRCRG